jgi:DNA invertase Pin-like site-specific DNA recombinase
LAGRFFRIVPRDVARDFIAQNPNGGRFRTPPAISKHNPIYVEERNQAICQAVLGGEERELLARRYKITIRTVGKILKANNIETRKERTETLEERIKLALRLGKAKTDIARDEGISRQRLYQIIKEKGITV